MQDHKSYDRTVSKPATATPAQALPGPASVKPGAYECATFSVGRLVHQQGLSRRLAGAGTCWDADGKSGAFSYDPATATILSRGGALAGTRALQQEQKGHPLPEAPERRPCANVDCDLE